ncbi:hypothetical protein [Pararhizobium haloflavum]|uniref:hypothetical protein n=1 Tax=Pararhizobium haloflavum TaxID=2037914 RepID=UPI000C19D6DB|nr:hypothetical protein [Pararhizobium haloflavum]
MANSAVSRLNAGIGALETMTRFALATLALASGVYTYLGVRGLLDGEATIVFFAAVIYSAAVSVGIYAFWTYMMRLFPHVAAAGARGALVGVMVLGSLMIVAMSSWLNAAALAGSAALEQHLAETLQDYTSDLDRAHENALAAQSLLPDIRLASERFSRLAAEERESGALTGTSGSGSVVQLLSQMSAQLGELETSVTQSRERVQSLFEEGQAHLATMRGLVSGTGSVDPRADEFAEHVVSLTGVIAAMEQTSVAPAVKRAADDLSLGFIAPIADGGEAGLVLRQDRVMGTIRQSVAAQSTALSQAADDILANEPVAERRFVPLSSAEAVLRYARDFVPSWAGAISIDLLPAVLIMVLAVVHSVLRDAETRVPFAERISAAELMMAMDVQRAIDARRPTHDVAVETAHEEEDAGSHVDAAVEQEPPAADRASAPEDPTKITALASPHHRQRKDG